MSKKDQEKASEHRPAATTVPAHAPLGTTASGTTTHEARAATRDAMASPVHRTGREGDLAAENERLRGLVAELGARVGMAGPGMTDAERRKIDTLKRETKREHGFHLYRVGPQGHYRDGRLYAPGEIVRIPEGQSPSVTFEAVKGDDDRSHIYGQITPSIPPPPRNVFPGGPNPESSPSADFTERDIQRAQQDREGQPDAKSEQGRVSPPRATDKDL